MYNKLVQIPRYDPFEVLFGSSKSYGNPFMDVTVTVEFTAPSGKRRTVSAFYDGEDVWRARLAPDEVGVWRYVTSASDASNAALHQQQGSFQCVPTSNRGFIRPDRQHRYYFAYDDGTPFFAVGDTCSVTTPALNDANRKAYLDARAGKPFNFLRMFASLTFNAWTGKPWSDAVLAEDAFPWGGTPQAPDYDRLNPRYFQRYERILREMKALDIHAEIVVYNMYEIPFKLPNVWTPTRETLWGSYLVSRLAADTTVFLWTVAQEYERYPDGEYRYDPSDDVWARRMADLIHVADPHRHPVSVHPWGRLPGDALDELGTQRGAMGERFGKGDAMDVITHQHNSYGTAREVAEPAPPHWDGPAGGVDQAVWLDRKYNKPIINTEYGYEWLQGAPPRGQMHATEKCRRAAWRLFTAGAAGMAAGFMGTVMSMDLPDTYYADKKHIIPFVVADMGHKAQLGYLYEFVTQRTGFRDMNPAQPLTNVPNLCLAHPGEEYVIYAPFGGKIRLDLSRTAGRFVVEWLNPRDGAYQDQHAAEGGAERVFATPDEDDWVLHLKRDSSSRPSG